MLGAFGFWLFFARINFNFFLSLVLSMTTIGVLGIIIERSFFKPFRGNLLPSFIISIGLIMILQTSALLVFGIKDKSVSTPSVLEGVIRIGSVVLSKERLVVILISAALVVLLYLFLSRSKPGLAMRAVAQDGEAAALQGISIDGASSLAMGIGCALAAAAGSLMAPIFYVNCTIGAVPVMKAFVVIILGGMGSFVGSIIGGFMVGFVESFASTLLGGPVAAMMIFGILVLVLIIRPTGLLGHD